MFPMKETLSSILRPRQATRRVDMARTFDSDPNTPSPGPANRNYGGQRHATADFTEADDDEDEDEFDLDDGPSAPRIPRPFQETNARRSSTSLMPLFSASYLGKHMIALQRMHRTRMGTYGRTRFPADLQCCSCYPNPRPDPNRDHAHLGPNPIPSGVSIPRKAYAAANSNTTFQSCNPVRPHGELPAVCEGGTAISR